MASTTKIAHAVGDRDEVPGDSSGKELLTQNWYMRTGGWDYLLMPPEDMREMAEAAVDIAIRIATNNAYGYSQDRRWTGYKKIQSYINAGLDVVEAIERGHGDFDCSSFVISCWKWAGLDIEASGYTGNMLRIFKDAGFSVVDGPLDDLDVNKGAIWLTPKHHTALSISDGPQYRPTPQPVPPPYEIPYVEVYRGKVNVRKSPSLNGAKWRIDGHSSAHAIKRFPYVGSVENEGRTWLCVLVDDDKTGYISYLRDYVRLVEE